MSNFVGNKPNPLSLLLQGAKKIITGGSQKDKGKAIKKVQVGTELAKKRKSQDDFVDFRSKLHTSAGFDTATKNKLKMKHPLYKSNKKTSDIFTPKEPKFSKGGRVGLKRGTGLMKKKSNIQKIKETFGPKNKSTKFGMLSVKAGIDKNPNPTQADRIAGAKMKNRMKAAFGGGADMGKVASDKTKAEVKKYEKRAKDASKFLKNKGRSFGSIMREKYMR